MTEERANAGAPGPIDPRDVDALDLVYLTSLTESRMASSVLIGQVDQEALDFMDIATRELALLAVARAVLPEGYVAVPVGAIQHVIEECTAPDDLFYNLIDGEWLRKHMRNMLHGSEPIEDPHHAVFDTRTHVAVPVAEIPDGRESVFYMYDPDHVADDPYIPHHEPSDKPWERIVLIGGDGNYGISLMYYPDRINDSERPPFEVVVPVRGGRRVQGALSQETMVWLRDWLAKVLPTESEEAR